MTSLLDVACAGHQPLRAPDELPASPTARLRHAVLAARLSLKPPDDGGTSSFCTVVKHPNLAGDSDGEADHAQRVRRRGQSLHWQQHQELELAFEAREAYREERRCAVQEERRAAGLLRSQQWLGVLCVA
eukprot:EG_transcript_47975